MKRLKNNEGSKRNVGGSIDQGISRYKRSMFFGSIGAGVITGGQLPSFLGIYTTNPTKRSMSRGVQRRRRFKKTAYRTNSQFRIMQNDSNEMEIQDEAPNSNGDPSKSISPAAKNGITNRDTSHDNHVSHKGDLTYETS